MAAASSVSASFCGPVVVLFCAGGQLPAFWKSTKVQQQLSRVMYLKYMPLSLITEPMSVSKFKAAPVGNEDQASSRVRTSAMGEYTRLTYLKYLHSDTMDGA